MGLRYTGWVRILIAPDKFKGSLSACEAGEAMARGARTAGRELGVALRVEVSPVADGGEGTLEALGAALGADFHEMEVVGPLPGMKARARWGTWMMEGTGEALGAIIEASQAVGIAMIPSDKRDAERATSFGLGQLIGAAIGAGRREILVGLGGSACVDGGIGMAQALGMGVSIDARSGLAVEGGPGSWSGVWGEAWGRGRLVALCDVDNPLLGERGSARVFGPQKGASAEQVERLEARLASLVELCRRKGLEVRPDAPGAGSAGGLGFGLATLLGARLTPGARMILDLTGFDDRVRGADLVVTGEGKFDAQTTAGKACAEVARRATRAGAACMVVAGAVERKDGEMERMLERAGARIVAVHALTDWGASEPECMREAGRMVEEATRRGIRDWLAPRA